MIIPTAAVLFGCGVWLAWQGQSIASFEKDCVVLEKQIAAAHTLQVTDFVNPKAVDLAKMVDDHRPRDWKKIAAQFLEMQQSSGVSEMRAKAKFGQWFQTMSQQELTAALDEIVTLDLTEKARWALEQMLIRPLIEKDPELALTHCILRIESSDSPMIRFLLASALRDWATKDPAKAIAWFDQEIAGRITSTARTSMAKAHSVKSLKGTCSMRC